ncbi:MAG: glutathione S-transferase family protein [Candidatus Melainabacteria bacterium]|nr:glutathione S-transferase family protein [Candidatus Melainabacteria bacterium]
MSKLKLYDYIESQNGYKVRLALSNLKVDYDWIQVDLKSHEQKKDWFLKLNPNGKVPTLVDDDFSIWESNAILLYLGRKFAPQITNSLIPQDIKKLGMMLEWITYESTTLSKNIGGARFLTKYMPPERLKKDELDKYKKDSKRNLKIVDEHLSKNNFLAIDYSMADISCYGQIYIAPEGNIDLSEFKNILAWQKRVESQLGYVEMKTGVKV